MLIVPRPFLGDSWTVTMGSAEVEAPASKLLTDVIRDGAMSTSGEPWATGIEATSPIDQDGESIDIAELVAHNRSQLESQYRIRVDSVAPVRSRVHRSPSGISNLSNLTGVVGDIQDYPEDPGSTRLEATSNGSNTVVRIQFPSYHTTERPLRTGASLQMFRVLIASSVNPATLPTVAFKLYESGTLKGTLTSSFSVPTAQGYIFYVPWNASLLGGAGTTELQIEGTTVGGQTPEYLSAIWVADMTGHDYDSGWLYVPLVQSSSERDSLYLRHRFDPPFVLSGTTRISIEWSQHAGYPLEVGRLIISGAEEIPLDRQQGWNPKWISNSDRRRSRGQQIRRRIRRPWRQVTWTAKYLAKSEAMATWFHGHLREAQDHRPLLFIPFPEDTDPQDDLFGVFQDSPPLEHEGFLNGEHHWSINGATIEEIP